MSSESAASSAGSIPYATLSLAFAPARDSLQLIRLWGLVGPFRSTDQLSSFNWDQVRVACPHPVLAKTWLHVEANYQRQPPLWIVTDAMGWWKDQVQLPSYTSSPSEEERYVAALSRTMAAAFAQAKAMFDVQAATDALWWLLTQEQNVPEQLVREALDLVVEGATVDETRLAKEAKRLRDAVIPSVTAMEHLLTEVWSLDTSKLRNTVFVAEKSIFEVRYPQPSQDDIAQVLKKFKFDAMDAWPLFLVGTSSSTRIHRRGLRFASMFSSVLLKSFLIFQSMAPQAEAHCFYVGYSKNLVYAQHLTSFSSTPVQSESSPSLPFGLPIAQHDPSMMSLVGQSDYEKQLTYHPSIVWIRVSKSDAREMRLVFSAQGSTDLQEREMEDILTSIESALSIPAAIRPRITKLGTSGSYSVESTFSSWRVPFLSPQDVLEWWCRLGPFSHLFYLLDHLSIANGVPLRISRQYGSILFPSLETASTPERPDVLLRCESSGEIRVVVSLTLTEPDQLRLLSVIKAFLLMLPLEVTKDMVRPLNDLLSPREGAAPVSAIHRLREAWPDVVRVIRQRAREASALIRGTEEAKGAGEANEDIELEGGEAKDPTELYPALFPRNYYKTRCQGKEKQPLIIGSAEARRLAEQDPRLVLSFPTDGGSAFPVRHYRCPEGSDYKFPRLQKNEAPDAVYPTFPCCFKTFREDKTARDKPIDARDNRILLPHIIKTEGQTGTLPLGLAQWLQFYNPADEYFRVGVQQGPHNVLWLLDYYHFLKQPLAGRKTEKDLVLEWSAVVRNHFDAVKLFFEGYTDAQILHLWDRFLLHKEPVVPLMSILLVGSLLHATRITIVYRDPREEIHWIEPVQFLWRFHHGNTMQALDCAAAVVVYAHHGGRIDALRSHSYPALELVGRSARSKNLSVRFFDFPSREWGDWLSALPSAWFLDARPTTLEKSLYLPDVSSSSMIPFSIDNVVGSIALVYLSESSLQTPLVFLVERNMSWSPFSPSRRDNPNGFTLHPADTNGSKRVWTGREFRAFFDAESPSVVTIAAHVATHFVWITIYHMVWKLTLTACIEKEPSTDLSPLRRALQRASRPFETYDSEQAVPIEYRALLATTPDATVKRVWTETHGHVVATLWRDMVVCLFIRYLAAEEPTLETEDAWAVLSYSESKQLLQRFARSVVQTTPAWTEAKIGSLVRWMWKEDGLSPKWTWEDVERHGLARRRPGALGLAVVHVPSEAFWDACAYNIEWLRRHDARAIWAHRIVPVSDGWHAPIELPSYESIVRTLGPFHPDASVDVADIGQHMEDWLRQLPSSSPYSGGHPYSFSLFSSSEETVVAAADSKEIVYEGIMLPRPLLWTRQGENLFWPEIATIYPVKDEEHGRQVLDMLSLNVTEQKRVSSVSNVRTLDAQQTDAYLVCTNQEQTWLVCRTSAFRFS